MRYTQYSIRNMHHKTQSTNSYVRIYQLFMRNKPNSPNVQMNLTFFTTMNYAIFASLTKVKNKANSNPIQTQLSQLKPILGPNKANSNPKQTQFQTNSSSVNGLKYFSFRNAKSDNWTV